MLGKEYVQQDWSRLVPLRVPLHHSSMVILPPGIINAAAADVHRPAPSSCCSERLLQADGCGSHSALATARSTSQGAALRSEMIVRAVRSLFSFICCPTF